MTFRDDVNASTDTGAATGDSGLSIPRAYWSAPVSEAAWCGVRPRLSRLLLLAPALALTSGYASAALAARGHLIASGWLLALAVCCILAGVVALGRHARRLVRYRTEAPRHEGSGQPYRGPSGVAR